MVVNSAARGQSTSESDLDFAILVNPTEVAPAARQQMERDWLAFSNSQPDLVNFRQSGRFTQIHLDIVTAEYTPEVWDDGGGPDYFEVEIGNQIAHSAPFSTTGAYFQQLQMMWLPYYDDTLRAQRLSMAHNACLYDLDHIPHYVERGLFSQAFDRLYKAHQEFLQALFIAHRTYPIAYNKWIRYQVVEWLNLPDLYAELPRTLSITNIESRELITKADDLRNLLDHWAMA